MKTTILSTTLLLCCILASPVAGGDEKPKPVKDSKVSAKNLDAPPKIYDDKADARAAIDAALTSAKKENRRVLIQWGGDWCPWCHRIYHQFKADKEVAKTMSYEYDLVLVDIGRREKNLDLATRYGVDLNKNGIPYLTVLDADGKVVANQPTEPFEKSNKEEKGYDSAKLTQFLKQHQAPYASAEAVLTAALSEAERTGRSVFLHFGAPWCGWCRRLDAWLARPDIAPIVARDFTNLKIDLDRMTGAAAVLKRYCAEPAGLPWIVLLDPKGKVLIDSTGPKGGIGFPAEDHEIAHFRKMVQSSKRSITDAEVKYLCQSLEDVAREIKSKHKPAT